MLFFRYSFGISIMHFLPGVLYNFISSLEISADEVVGEGRTISECCIVSVQPKELDVISVITKLPVSAKQHCGICCVDVSPFPKSQKKPALLVELF